MKSQLHIIGKVYEVNAKNMNLLIAELDRFMKAQEICEEALEKVVASLATARHIAADTLFEIEEL